MYNLEGRQFQLSLLRQIDDLCDRFEEEWRRGARPAIEKYLEAVPGPGQPALLRALLKVELELLQRHGAHADADQYQRRFHGQADVVNEVFADLQLQPIHARVSSTAEMKLRDVPSARVNFSHLATPRKHVQTAVALEVTEGPHRRVKFTFDRHETFLVGRARQARLRLNKDPHFSRYHFRLEVNPPGCYLVDLESRNGTFVNGRRVRDAFLEDGDLISGGDTKIRFTIVRAAPQDSCDTPTLAFRSNGRAPSIRQSAAQPLPLLSTATTDTTNKAPAPIQQIPGYDMVEELGRGSMGVVYRAIRKSTNAEVAIKVIVPAHTVRSEAMQLFVREASILSQLRHPRIIRFYEMGMVSGQLFYAMEYIKIVPLQEAWAGRSLSSRIRTACGILCQVLAALAYAHARSLVHRDVKPGNVLLTRAGRKLRSKLADFGIAKNYINAGFSEMTREGEARGSLAFMPPEQVINSRDARPSCDIYSAGATLYQYLSGKLPFDFSGGRSKFSVVLENDPIPLREHRPDLPRELTAIVHRALAKDPADRFPSAQQMRRALLPFAQRS